MSDVGRYRLVYTRLWRHPGFRGLSPASRLIAMYLLTGPQGNRLGLFHLAPATAADDLKVSADTFRKGLTDVAATFGWMFDNAAGVFYIPSWWRWNAPQNANVLKGCLKDLNEIPPSALTEVFARNIETLPETFHQTFIEGIRQRLGRPSPTQEQYQEAVQKQEPEPRALHVASLASNGDRHQKLLTIARETLLVTNPNGPLEELIDAFHYTNKNTGSKVDDCTRSEVTAALNAALSERREAIV